MSPLLLMRLEAAKKSVAEEDEVTAVGVTRNCWAPGEGTDGISSAESRVAQSVDPFPLCGRHSGILTAASQCRVLAVSRGKSTGGF